MEDKKKKTTTKKKSTKKKLDLTQKIEKAKNYNNEDDNFEKTGLVTMIYPKNVKKSEPKKKYKLKKLNLISLIIIIISAGVLAFSTTKIVKWFIDNKNMKDQIKNVQVKAHIKETEDNEKTEIIENNVPESDPYWDYIKMNLINVDFNELKQINNETVGWIQVNGTNINYPFVQTSNNDYYLTHQFDKKGNGGGWVFMDYRNNPQDFNQNTILYAHGRENNTMFGTLKNSLTNGWLDDANNYVVKLSTEYENTLWQVFSVYKIPNTNDYLQIEFNTGQDFIDFGNMLIERSQHNFGTELNENDKILTLSTCFNDYEKVVLHAKLIKREAR